MKNIFIMSRYRFCIVFFSLFLFSLAAHAQTTAFTYQGRLTDSSIQANGIYDLQFTLTDASGNAVGSPVVREDVSVVNGIFTVSLDFGANAFDGSSRELEVGVRRGSETGAFTILAPRQPLTSTPYAIRAVTATTADTSTRALSADTSTTATTANTATTAGNVTGVVAIANGGTGSTTQNFVDLTTTQANIAGNKTFTGVLTGNAVNTQTQFNLNGSRILSAPGANNLFAGINSGFSNTSGRENAFFGLNSGFSNTSGTNNSFLGREAGFLNTTGDANSFFGQQSGFSNTTGGNNAFFGTNTGRASTTGEANSFFGTNAGRANTVGNFNTIIGASANLGANNLTFATALGAGAVVGTSNTVVLGRSADNVQIPGNLSVAGTFNGSGAGFTNLNASNIASGTLDNARLGIVPIAKGGTGSTTQNFVDLTTTQTNIAGNKTFTGNLTVNGNILLGASGNLSVVASQDNLRVVIGLVRVNGDLTLTPLLGSGYTVVRNRAGVYTITFTPAFGNAPVLTPSLISGPMFVSLSDISSNSVTITTFAPSGASADAPYFQFVAIGQR